MREPKKFSLECVLFTQHTVPMGGQHRSQFLKFTCTLRKIRPDAAGFGVDPSKCSHYAHITLTYMSKLEASFRSSAFAVRSDYVISRIWRAFNAIGVLHFFGNGKITTVIKDFSAAGPIVPLRKSCFPFSVRAAVRAIRAAGRPIDAPRSGCLCGLPVFDASGVVRPRSVAGVWRFSLCKPPLTTAAKRSLRKAKKDSVSFPSRASSLFSRRVPCGMRRRLRRRVTSRVNPTGDEGPQDENRNKGRRVGKTSDLPYLEEAALDDFLRWIEEVNPPPSMVAVPVPISLGTVPTTAWCSSADAAVLRCRFDYHAAETSFRNEGKQVRYVYNDVSSAANRPRTVSPRKCGRVFLAITRVYSVVRLP